MANQQSQVRALAKLVARAFSVADLPPEARVPGKIDLPNLPWRVPPLMPSAKLCGEPLDSYFDSALNFEAKDMMAFWQKAMVDTWHQPGLAIKGGTYEGLRGLLRTAKIGSRVLRFAQPPGYPDLVDETAGIQLSLEVAHTVFVSLPIRKRVFTINDYWVETADGLRFGIENGRPLVDSLWTYDATAEVLDFLERPRGPEIIECLYDQIASMRSTVHLYKSHFRDDFAGMDMALQALRFLSWGGYCPELITAVQTVPTDIPLLKMREQAVRDAREVMDSARLNDKQKLETVKTLLVPNVLGLSRFRRHIYASDHFPFTLSLNKEGQIKEWLRDYYETEIPQNLRRMT
jgi:hypothetical protein